MIDHMLYDEVADLMQPGDRISFRELLMARPPWMQRAACKGHTDDFFPTRGADVRPAKALCVSCPVIEECADYAANDDAGYPLHGIWAGTTGRGRRRHRDAA